MGTVVMVVTMLVFMTLGVPVSIAVGVAALVGVLVTDTPLDVVPRMMIENVDSFALLAVPFFVVAGNLMNVGGITERIFNFARDIFGWMRGGLAQVTVGAEMIFSGMSGAALADLAGLGVVVIKAMRDQRYPVPFAAAVMLAACVLGPIIPPSIVFVIYGLATDTSVGRLFLAGIVPGVFVGILLMIHISIYMRVKKPDWGKPEPFVARNAWNSFRKGAFALLSPFVVIGAILAGVATPSEIGAIAAGYALLAFSLQGHALGVKTGRENCVVIRSIHADGAATCPRKLELLEERKMKTATIMFAAGYVLTGCAYLTPPLEHPSFEQHAQNRMNTFGVIPSRRMMIVKSEDPNDRNEKRVLICAEAPADVTDNLASTLAASAAVSAKAADASAGVSKTVETFGRSLFKRTQGIQLFRDRSYYLCQARMNGFITDEEYKTSLNEAFKDVIPLIEKELAHLPQPDDNSNQAGRVSSPEIKSKAGDSESFVGKDKVESRAGTTRRKTEQ